MGFRPGCQKIDLTFFSVLSLIILVLQRVSNGYFKENYNFPRFQRGSEGVQHFPGGGGEGSSFFQGGGGVQILISIETRIICDFPGVRTLYPGGEGALHPPMSQSVLSLGLDCKVKGPFVAFQ